MEVVFLVELSLVIASLPPYHSYKHSSLLLLLPLLPTLIGRFDAPPPLPSPQRLCVALTRARHHLIVMGEKRVLLTNPLWREIATTCAGSVALDAVKLS